MILGLLRHGVAEDASAATGYRDEPRALTEEGRRRMLREARGIRHVGVTFDVVLTSPLTRCEETAQIVSDALGAPLRRIERLSPGVELDRLLEVLFEYPDAQSVLVCGHQPDMGLITAELIGGGDIEFKKGALAIVDLTDMRPRGGVLRGHFPPSVLRRMGASTADA